MAKQPKPDSEPPLALRPEPQPRPERPPDSRREAPLALRSRAAKPESAEREGSANKADLTFMALHCAIQSLISNFVTF